MSKDEHFLVEALKRHDTDALSYLYDYYAAALKGVIMRVVRHEDIAEEVLQDTFLKIWDKISSYDAGKGRLFTWMLNIARNQAIDKTRSREMSQGKKTGDLDNFVHQIDRTENEEVSVDAIGLQEILKRLPDDQRFIVDQLYLKGYTQSEVAEEFGIPLGTVKTRLRLAMMELRSLLNVS